MINSDMQIIILAAGEGTRLRPYTLERPKCLVEVDGVSLLDTQIAVLKSQFLSNIIIVGGYKSEMLRRDDSKLLVNSRYYETNMVWTLFSAEEELNGDVLICYGDIVYSKEILQSILKSDSDIAVTVDKDWEEYWRARGEDPLDDAETLKMDTEGRLYEIGKKPSSLSDIEAQYMGLVKLTEKGVKSLKNVFNNAKNDISILGKSVENAYMTDLLQATIDAGIPVQGVEINAGWIEVDTVSDLLLEATRDRLQKIRKDI